MKKIILIVAVLLKTGYVFSQRITQSQIEILTLKKNVLYVISLNDGSEINTKDSYLFPNELDKPKRHLKGEEIKKYTNDETITEVCLDAIKPGVKLVQMNDILSKYNVDQKYRNYAVLIDDLPVSDKNNIAIADASIREVIVSESQQVIDIRTKGYENFIRLKKSAEEERQKNIQLYRQAHPRQQ